MATATATQAPFTWEGTDRTGKKVKGKVVSTSEAAVRTELRRQGVVADARAQAEHAVPQAGQGHGG